MILGIVLTLLALFGLIVGVLAWTKRLPGNSIVGLKVPEVRKSQENWDLAHRVAGPLWVVASISMLLAAMIAFVVEGLMWLIVVFALMAAVVFVSLGANLGARAVSLLPAGDTVNGGCGENCNCGDTECGDSEQKKAPTVDLTALRKAASAKDA